MNLSVESRERTGVQPFSEMWGRLPTETFARWASILFTLSVWTYLLSLAASQALLAAAGICYAVHLLHENRRIEFPPMVGLPLLLFCGLTTLSVICASSPTQGWFAVRKLVLFLILVLAINLVVSRPHLETIFKGLFLESALAAVVAAGQFISRYQAMRIAHPREIYRYMAFQERVQGFMGDWMNFGGQQMLVLAALVAFLLFKPCRRRLWWTVMLVILMSIVFSLTRAVWVGSFVAGVYILACWKPRWLVAIPVVMGIAYAGAPDLLRQRVRMALHPMADPALSIRFEMWQVGLRMVRTHPWLGVGPDDIDRDYPLYLPNPPKLGYHGHLHDNFVQLAADRGLPALAVWIWFMAVLGWQLLKTRERLRAGKWIGHAGLACWCGFLAEGLFEFNFGTSPVLMLFLFMAAAPFAAEQLEREPMVPVPVSAVNATGAS